jgi:hypothetical protein
MSAMTELNAELFPGARKGPSPSRAESKADATDRAARTIIDGEAARREAKTERLRLARLAREEAEAAAAPVKPKVAAKKKATPAKKAPAKKAMAAKAG